MYYYINCELRHHGIKGQKWGVRRYQNPDGTLTAMGKVRYKSRNYIDVGKQAIKDIMLYHGSKTGMLSELIPRVSLEQEPLVYATDDKSYALIRAGHFDYSKNYMREEHMENNKHVLAELYPGAFKDVFDHKGYIYQLDGGDFQYNYGTEYISKNKTKIKNTEVIDNVLDAIKKDNNIQLVYFDNPGDYWDNVRGGLEGYLERRNKSVAAMKEAQKIIEKLTK